MISIINGMFMSVAVPFEPYESSFLKLCNFVSAIVQYPRCFCPWTFFQNIEINMLPSAPFISYLYSEVVYFTDEFQLRQLIDLVVFGAVEYTQASCMLVFFFKIYFQKH